MSAYDALGALLGGSYVADVACPRCGADRRSPTNRSRRVLRLWRSAGLISFHCVRCGEHGCARDDERNPIDRETWQRQRAELAVFLAAGLIDKARQLIRDRLATVKPAPMTKVGRDWRRR